MRRLTGTPRGERGGPALASTHRTHTHTLARTVHLTSIPSRRARWAAAAAAQLCAAAAGDETPGVCVRLSREGGGICYSAANVHNSNN